MEGGDGVQGHQGLVSQQESGSVDAVVARSQAPQRLQFVGDAGVGGVLDGRDFVLGCALPECGVGGGGVVT